MKKTKNKKNFTPKKASDGRPRTDKSLGQHYLSDQKIINEIVHNHQGLYNFLMEVGPGPAVLTKGLKFLDKPLVVFEMDQRFKPFLDEILPENNIIMGDALNANFSEVIKMNHLQAPGHLVSNLPYNVSVPLFIKFLATEELKFLTLMFQKEVAEKIHPFGGRKENEMGSLMALSQTYFETKKLCLAPPGAFTPPPKVHSAVVSLVRREYPAIPLSDWQNFETFCRKLFAHRRKQAQKVLKAHYPLELIDQAFSKCHIKMNDRAESFDLAQVHGLYDILGKK